MGDFHESWYEWQSTEDHSASRLAQIAALQRFPAHVFVRKTFFLTEIFVDILCLCSIVAVISDCLLHCPSQFITDHYPASLYSTM
jgi:hypothetical protein